MSPFKYQKMNLKKSVLSLGLAIAVILPSIASSNANAPKASHTAIQEIHNAISLLDIDYRKYSGTEIMVKFMINESDELIILSTGDSDLDQSIKSSLNYKSVKSNELKAYKVYILPVKFEAKK